MSIKIKVWKIAIKKVYHEKCTECGRKLKKALYTEAGVLGYNCYLRACGLKPVKRVTLNTMPAEAYEGIASGVIKKLVDLSPKEFAYHFATEEEVKHCIKVTPLKFILRLKYREEETINLVFRKAILADICGIPQTIINKVINTKTFTKYWRYLNK